MVTDGNFTSDLNDRTSDGFKEIEQDICDQVRQVMVLGGLDEYEECEVESISSGSLIIQLIITIQQLASQTVTESYIAVANVFVVHRGRIRGRINIFTGWNKCQSNPCQNYGTCVDLWDGYVCKCSDGFCGINCQSNIQPSTTITESCSLCTTTITESQTPVIPSCSPDITTILDATTITESQTPMISSCSQDTTTVTESQTPCSIDTTPALETTTISVSASCFEDAITNSTSQSCPREATTVVVSPETVTFCPPESTFLPDVSPSPTSDDVSPTPEIPFACPTEEPEINYCEGDPCENGGACYNVSTGYRCLCPSGYIGENCTLDLDECNNNSTDYCGPNTRCVDLPGSYDCVCEEGYLTVQDGYEYLLDQGCTMCAAGFQGKGSLCEKCPMGQYKAIEGSSNCTTCPEGSTTETNGTQSQRHCVCDKGYFRQFQNCYECAVGTYKNALGDEACSPCPPGTYNDETGQVECSSCPTGTHNYWSGQTECTICPGTVTNNRTECDCSGVGPSVWCPPTSNWTAGDPVAIFTFDTHNFTFMEDTTVIDDPSPYLVAGQRGLALSTNHTEKQWTDLGDLSHINIVKPECKAGTVLVWVKVIDGETSSAYLSSFRRSTTGFYLMYDKDNNAARYYVNTAGKTFEAEQIPPILGEWLHIAVVFHGPAEGEGISVYHNGTLFARDTTATYFKFDDNDGNVVIGRWYTSQSRLYGSYCVDDVMFFNSALTAEEIWSIYYSYS